MGSSLPKTGLIKSLRRAALLMAVALTLGGCIQSDQEYTLNPDGSGKVVCENTFPVMPNFGNSDEKNGGSSGNGVAAAVINELNLSEGVEAWKEVSYKMTDDKKIWFKGTAYFKDINQLRLHNGGFQSKKGEVSFVPDKKGLLVLKLESDSSSMDKGPEEEAPEGDPVPKMSKKEIGEEVQKARDGYKDAQGIMSAMLGNFRIKKVFHLPGTLQEAAGFEKGEGGSLTYTLDGASITKLMDALMADDVYMAEEIAKGKKPLKDLNSFPKMSKQSQEAFQALTNQRATVKKTVQPQFDYEAEAAAAKKESAKIMSQLLIARELENAPAMDSDGYINHGIEERRKGNDDQAIENYNKALELKPDDGDAYLNRGAAYAHKGDHDLAIADYNKALELDPKDADAYFNRANTYYSQGHAGQAITDYGKAIKLKPDNEDAYLNRGFAYGHDGKYDLAIADYKKALSLKPDDEDAYLQLGKAYLKAGQKQRAKETWKKGLKINPNNPHLLKELKNQEK